MSDVNTIAVCPRCGAKNRVDGRADRMRPVCGRCRTALAADGAAGATAAGPAEPLVVNDESFARGVLGAGHTPVLVDCWAPWCGPCRMLAPTIDALAAESQGRYLVAKLNTDENPRTASAYGINSIPTLLLFQDGRVMDKLVGVQSKAALASRLAALA